MKYTPLFLALLVATGTAVPVNAQVVDPYGNIQIGNGTSISPPSNPDSPNTVKTGQIVIGDGARTDGQDAMAEGTDASAEGNEAIAKGPRAKAKAMWAQAIGAEAEANAINTTATGHQAKANDAGGTATGALSEACDVRATATGIQAKACGWQSTATGAGAEGTASDTTVNGALAKATKERATTVGAWSEVNGVNGTNVGAGSKVNADRATCVGASCEANHANSVGVGYGTKTTQENEVAVGYRVVTQVSSGRDDTDAANMSQVRATAEHLGGGAGFDSTTGAFIAPTYNFISGATYNDVGSALYDLDARVYNLEQNPGGGQGPAGPAGADGASAYQVAVNNGFTGTETEWLESLRGADGRDGKDGAKAVAGSNIEVSDNEDGSQTVSLADNVQLSDQGSVSVGATTVDGRGVRIAGGPSMTSQGIDAGNQKITSVAPGRIERGSTDAVNGGQMWDLERRMDDRWQETNRQIERVGAQSAALSMMNGAATYLPVGKVALNAGWGQYGSQSAFAVGAKARLSERSSLAIGFSYSGGKAMGGVGYSLIID